MLLCEGQELKTNLTTNSWSYAIAKGSHSWEVNSFEVLLLPATNLNHLNARTEVISLMMVGYINPHVDHIE